MTTRTLSSTSPNAFAVSLTGIAVLASVSVGWLFSFDLGALISVAFLVGFLSLMLSGWASARLSESR